MVVTSSGVFVPQLGLVPMGQSQDLVREIESLGYGTLWLAEANGRDPFVNAGLLLTATETLVVGTGIANIWARDALAMHAAAATLGEAFPGRFVLGLGVSHQPLVDGMRGHAYAKPMETMVRYLDGLDVATYSALAPQVPVPRMLGALGPRMLELASERTAGVVPYFTTPSHTAAAREKIGGGDVCPIVAVVLDPDPSSARETARRAHTSFYMGLPNYTNNLRRFGFDDDEFRDGGSDRLIDAVVAHGTVDAIARRIGEHRDAGANHVGIYVVTGGREVPMQQLRDLAPVLTETPRIAFESS